MYILFHICTPVLTCTHLKKTFNIFSLQYKHCCVSTVFAACVCYLCMFEVNAMCFRSAVSSLFDKPNASVEKNAAINIMWSELEQNRHHCCYTVTHSAHGAHWVRTGKNHIAALMCVTKQNTASIFACENTG